MAQLPHQEERAADRDRQQGGPRRLELTLLASADHGSEYAAFDGLLTVVLLAAYLLAAYLLADGWTAWRIAR